MGVARGERLGSCARCGKRGVYRAFGSLAAFLGRPDGVLRCRYCGDRPGERKHADPPRRTPSQRRVRELLRDSR